jgi:hypothetical protein
MHKNLEIYCIFFIEINIERKGESEKMGKLLTQESVRERFVKLTKDGVMSKYIANQVSIPESSLSKYKHRKYELPNYELVQLSEWLSSRGY